MPAFTGFAVDVVEAVEDDVLGEVYVVDHSSGFAGRPRKEGILVGVWMVSNWTELSTVMQRSNRREAVSVWVAGGLRKWAQGAWRLSADPKGVGSDMKFR